MRKLFTPILLVLLFDFSHGSLALAQSPMDLIWAKRAGGIGQETGERAALFADGSVTVTGHFTLSATFGEGASQVTLVSAGNTDCFIAKYDKDGRLLWAKNAGGTGNDLALGIAGVEDGSAIITGQFERNAVFGEGASRTVLTAPATGMFLAKYDGNGSLLWAKSAGGFGNVSGYALHASANGDSVVTGYFFQAITFGTGTASVSLTSAHDTVFIAKYDDDGILQWATMASAGSRAVGMGVAFLPDGSITLTGDCGDSTTFGSGQTQVTLPLGIFLAKYQGDGGFLWAKSITSALSCHAYDVAALPDGGAVFTGSFVTNLKFGEGTQQIALSGFGADDMFVARYSADGTPLWAKRGGGTLTDTSYGIAAFPDGSSVTTGHFYGSATFGEGAESVTLTAAGYEANDFLAKYNFDGSLAWATRMGSAHGDTWLAESVTTSQDGTAVLTGYFDGQAIFGQGAQQTTLNSSGAEDVYVVKYFCGPIDIPVFDLAVDSTPIEEVAISSTSGNAGITNYETQVDWYSVVKLTAPTSDSRGYVFSKWILDGAAQPQGQRTIQFTMSKAMTATAEYMRAHTFYVNDDTCWEQGSQCSAPGDDGSDGLTPTSPKRHIQAILDAYPDVATGDTISVDPGIYAENVFIDEAHSGLSISGAGFGKSVIDGASDGTCLEFDSVNAGNLEGFTLRNGASSTSGGGLKLVTSSIHVRNLEIVDCAAGSFGGGISISAGAVVLTNCIITGNTADSGGGIYVEGSEATVNVTNCVISANSAADQGTGLNVASGTVTLANSILWNNLGASAEVWLRERGTAQFNRCDVQGGRSGIHDDPGSDLSWSDANNLSVEPMFTAGFRLLPGSPCIDAADSASAPDTDIEGTARYDVECMPNMGNGFADIGVYELVWNGHILTVNSGTGDGYYLTGTIIPIAADNAPQGLAFRGWTGDTANVANANSRNTTLTMPAANATVTATYDVAHLLVVTSGTGSGLYCGGATVRISATSPPSGYEFAGWVGDTASVANVASANTTLVMPNSTTVVTATYKLIKMVTLMVINGTGSGSYRSGTQQTIHAATPPAGLYFRLWKGDVQYVANPYSTNTTVTIPGDRDTITVTANFGAQLVAHHLSVVNGSGSGNYREDEIINIAANAPAQNKRFERWTGDTVCLANPLANSTAVTMPDRDMTVSAVYCDVYTLTLTRGSGGGSYRDGEIVSIIADAPPSGLLFGEWIGDNVLPLGSRWEANTTVTMPAANILFMATYYDPSMFHNLTVNSGTGDGVYFQTRPVAVSANPAPAGMRFDQWVGDVGGLEDIYAADTTFTVPTTDAAITATYTTTAISITNPNEAGITLERGAKLALAWNAATLNAKQPLRIELVNGGGQRWLLTEKAQAGKGTFSWTIGKLNSKTQPPYPDNDSYRIRISTLDGGTACSSRPFAIGSVDSLEIAGPSSVTENSVSQFTCIAHYNYGAPRELPYGAVKWATSSKVAKIKLGTLTVGEIASDQNCAVIATYGKGSAAKSATATITIRNN